MIFSRLKERRKKSDTGNGGEHLHGKKLLTPPSAAACFSWIASLAKHVFSAFLFEAADIAELTYCSILAGSMCYSWVARNIKTYATFVGRIGCFLSPEWGEEHKRLYWGASPGVFRRRRRRPCIASLPKKLDRLLLLWTKKGLGGSGTFSQLVVV